MNFSSFKEEVIRALKERLSDEFTIDTNKVLKNNSVVLEGLLIKEGNQSIVPSIYLEPFFSKYLAGRTIPEIVEDILIFYQETKSRPNLKSIDLSRTTIVDNLFFKLVNYARNKELLKDSIYYEVQDLAAVVFFCVDSGSEELASVRLTKSLCDRYEISEEEALRCALNNSDRLFPPVVKPIADVLFHINEIRKARGLFSDELEKLIDEVPLYVLSNEKGVNGATCLLYKGLLDGLYRRFEEDFYILPSSVHEVLLFPASACDDAEYLREMVNTVNQNEVDAIDILSDRVYHFPIDRFEIM